MKPIYLLLTIFGVLTASLFFSSNLTGQVSEEKAKVEVMDKKKLVILTGEDKHHPCGAHEFRAGGIILKDSIEKSVISDKVEVIHVYKWPEDTSVFDDADMVLHYYNGNKYHPLTDHVAIIDELATKGVSQMFVHYACDPDTKINENLKLWTGGVYKDKFSANPFWTLESILENHPINQGVEKYTLNDEWYLKIDFEGKPQMGYEETKVGPVHAVMSGKNVDEKPHKKFKNAVKNDDGSAKVVFWAKEAENGCRGIGLTGAHYHTAWANDDFRKQVLNSITWGLKLEVPEAGVDSPAISEERINENLETLKPKQQKLTL